MYIKEYKICNDSPCSFFKSIFTLFYLQKNNTINEQISTLIVAYVTFNTDVLIVYSRLFSTDMLKTTFFVFIPLQYFFLNN